MSTKRRTIVRQRNFFNDSLRLEALTHKSYHYENPSTGPHNERLEFLGDSIVSFVVANYLYGRFPHFKEGQLTLLRANLVCKKKLAQFALQLGLDTDIRLGVGALRDGGRASEKVLEDAFEAYIGAVFLDSDSSMSEVQKFMEPLLAPAVDELTRYSPHSTSVLKQKLFQDNNNIQLQMLIADQILNSDLQDPINKLQTWSQRRGMGIPVYKPCNELNAVFSVGVIINGKCYGYGQARNKKDAKKEAAINALQHVTATGQNNEFTPKNELQSSNFSSKHKYSIGSKRILYGLQ